MSHAGYVGRFAPSPTGPLHFGSLVAAAGSYLQARAHHGRWLLRVEDIDPPREVAGASADIIRTLETFGFQWDGEIVYQSTRIAHYRARLAELDGDLFLCTCSRKTIAAAVARGRLPAGRYPGTCRDRGQRNGGNLRVRCDALAPFDDALRGTIAPAQGPDDFIVWRRDDLPSYQWAVTLDDAEQGVTEIVRGADLLDTTPRQIFLLRRLGAPVPGFMHLPLVVNRAGQKLSKQTGARPLPPDAVGPTLCAALRALGLPAPAALERESGAQIWRWATRRWKPNALKDINTISFVAD